MSSNAETISGQKKDQSLAFHQSNKGSYQKGPPATERLYDSGKNTWLGSQSSGHSVVESHADRIPGLQYGRFSPSRAYASNSYLASGHASERDVSWSPSFSGKESSSQKVAGHARSSSAVGLQTAGSDSFGWIDSEKEVMTDGGFGSLVGLNRSALKQPAASGRAVSSTVSKGSENIAGYSLATGSSYAYATDVADELYGYEMEGSYSTEEHRYGASVGSAADQGSSYSHVPRSSASNIKSYSLPMYSSHSDSVITGKPFPSSSSQLQSNFLKSDRYGYESNYSHLGYEADHSGYESHASKSSDTVMKAMESKVESGRTRGNPMPSSHSSGYVSGYDGSSMTGHWDRRGVSSKFEDFTEPAQSKFLKNRGSASHQELGLGSSNDEMNPWSTSSVAASTPGQILTQAQPNQQSYDYGCVELGDEMIWDNSDQSYDTAASHAYNPRIKSKFSVYGKVEKNKQPYSEQDYSITEGAKSSHYHSSDTIYTGAPYESEFADSSVHVDADYYRESEVAYVPQYQEAVASDTSEYHSVVTSSDYYIGKAGKIPRSCSSVEPALYSSELSGNRGPAAIHHNRQGLQYTTQWSKISDETYNDCQDSYKGSMYGDVEASKYSKNTFKTQQKWEIPFLEDEAEVISQSSASYPMGDDWNAMASKAPSVAKPLQQGSRGFPAAVQPDGRLGGGMLTALNPDIVQKASTSVPLKHSWTTSVASTVVSSPHKSSWGDSDSHSASYKRPLLDSYSVAPGNLQLQFKGSTESNQRSEVSWQRSFLDSGSQCDASGSTSVPLHEMDSYYPNSSYESHPDTHEDSNLNVFDRAHSRHPLSHSDFDSGYVTSGSYQPGSGALGQHSSECWSEQPSWWSANTDVYGSESDFKKPGRWESQFKQSAGPFTSTHMNTSGVSKSGSSEWMYEASAPQHSVVKTGTPQAVTDFRTRTTLTGKATEVRTANLLDSTGIRPLTSLPAARFDVHNQSAGASNSFTGRGVRLVNISVASTSGSNKSATSGQISSSKAYQNFQADTLSSPANATTSTFLYPVTRPLTALNTAGFRAPDSLAPTAAGFRASVASRGKPFTSSTISGVKEVSTAFGSPIRSGSRMSVTRELGAAGPSGGIRTSSESSIGWDTKSRSASSSPSVASGVGGSNQFIHKTLSQIASSAAGTHSYGLGTSFTTGSKPQGSSPFSADEVSTLSATGVEVSVTFQSGVAPISGLNSQSRSAKSGSNSVSVPPMVRLTSDTTTSPSFRHHDPSETPELTVKSLLVASTASAALSQTVTGVGGLVTSYSSSMVSFTTTQANHLGTRVSVSSSSYILSPAVPAAPCKFAPTGSTVINTVEKSWPMTVAVATVKQASPSAVGPGCQTSSVSSSTPSSQISTFGPGTPLNQQSAVRSTSLNSQSLAATQGSQSSAVIPSTSGNQLSAIRPATPSGQQSTVRPSTPRAATPGNQVSLLHSGTQSNHSSFVRSSTPVGQPSTVRPSTPSRSLSASRAATPGHQTAVVRSGTPSNQSSFVRSSTPVGQQSAVRSTTPSSQSVTATVGGQTTAGSSSTPSGQTRPTTPSGQQSAVRSTTPSVPSSVLRASTPGNQTTAVRSGTPSNQSSFVRSSTPVGQQSAVRSTTPSVPSSVLRAATPGNQTTAVRSGTPSNQSSFVRSSTPVGQPSAVRSTTPSVPSSLLRAGNQTTAVRSGTPSNQSSFVRSSTPVGQPSAVRSTTPSVPSSVLRAATPGNQTTAVRSGTPSNQSSFVRSSTPVGQQSAVRSTTPSSQSVTATVGGQTTAGSSSTPSGQTRPTTPSGQQSAVRSTTPSVPSSVLRAATPGNQTTAVRSGTPSNQSSFVRSSTPVGQQSAVRSTTPSSQSVTATVGGQTTAGSSSTPSGQTRPTTPSGQQSAVRSTTPSVPSSVLRAATPGNQTTAVRSGTPSNQSSFVRSSTSVGQQSAVRSTTPSSQSVTATVGGQTTAGSSSTPSGQTRPTTPSGQQSAVRSTTPSVPSSVLRAATPGNQTTAVRSGTPSNQSSFVRSSTPVGQPSAVRSTTPSVPSSVLRAATPGNQTTAVRSGAITPSNQTSKVLPAASVDRTSASSLSTPSSQCLAVRQASQTATAELKVPVGLNSTVNSSTSVSQQSTKEAATPWGEKASFNPTTNGHSSATTGLRSDQPSKVISGAEDTESPTDRLEIQSVQSSPQGSSNITGTGLIKTFSSQNQLINAEESSNFASVSISVSTNRVTLKVRPPGDMKSSDVSVLSASSASAGCAGPALTSSSTRPQELTTSNLNMKQQTGVQQAGNSNLSQSKGSAIADGSSGTIQKSRETSTSVLGDQRSSAASVNQHDAADVASGQSTSQKDETKERGIDDAVTVSGASQDSLLERLMVMEPKAVMNEIVAGRVPVSLLDRVADRLPAEMLQEAVECLTKRSGKPVTRLSTVLKANVETTTANVSIDANMSKTTSMKRKLAGFDPCAWENLSLDGRCGLFSQTIQEVLGGMFKSDSKTVPTSHQLLSALSADERNVVTNMQKSFQVRDASEIVDALQLLHSLDPAVVEALGKLDSAVVCKAMAGNARAERVGHAALRCLVNSVTKQKKTLLATPVVSKTSEKPAAAIATGAKRPAGVAVSSLMSTGQSEKRPRMDMQFGSRPPRPAANRPGLFPRPRPRVPTYEMRQAPARFNMQRGSLLPTPHFMRGVPRGGFYGRGPFGY